jgi:hypothetical protein
MENVWYGNPMKNILEINIWMTRNDLVKRTLSGWYDILIVLSYHNNMCARGIITASTVRGVNKYDKITRPRKGNNPIQTVRTRRSLSVPNSYNIHVQSYPINWRYIIYGQSVDSSRISSTGGVTVGNQSPDQALLLLVVLRCDRHGQPLLFLLGNINSRYRRVFTAHKTVFAVGPESSMSPVNGLRRVRGAQYHSVKFHYLTDPIIRWRVNNLNNLAVKANTPDRKSYWTYNTPSTIRTVYKIMRRTLYYNTVPC